MRKHLLLVCVLGLTVQSFAQDKKAGQNNGAVISWEKKTHDFGNVQGGKVEHTFYFTNTGNEPLIITNVQVSCDCTTLPKGWPRDPIPPNANGEITVSFNATGKVGIQHKPVTLVTNAINPEGNTITFTMNVLDKETQ